LETAFSPARGDSPIRSYLLILKLHRKKIRTEEMDEDARNEIHLM